MELLRGIIIKAKEDHRQHFILRASERYGIMVCESDYDMLCDKFKGVFKKNVYKSIGYVFHNDVKIWCLYSRNVNCITTCYPSVIEQDPNQLIISCFAPAIRPLAFVVYNSYLSECEEIRKDFETTKDAALYYFSNTLFPSLHIDMFKFGKVKPFKIMSQIKNCLNDESKYIHFVVAKNK